MMWKEHYKVGVETIDTQHEELFNRVSEFIKNVQGKDSWESKVSKVKETLSFMQEYVVFHFEEEENYQESIGYADIDSHKKQHQKFTQGIHQYVTRFETEGFTKELVQEFGGKLITWLIMHVASIDQKIGEYVQNQGRN